MGGEDLARAALARLPGIKVMLASGYGGAPQVAGAAMLPKPYTLDSLRVALAGLAPAPGTAA